jgi:plastocyanin
MTTETTPKGKSNTGWYIAAAVIIIVVIIVGVVVAMQLNSSGTPSTSPTPTPTATPTPTGSPGTVKLDIYAGEVSSSTYGFGNSANSIQSPGPSLNFKVGDVVTVTLHNAGTMPHNWALVDAKSSTANVLFNAQIASSSSPVQPDSTGQVTFTVTQAGNFYYICQVDAHVTLGMWGTVTVRS